MGAKHFPVMVPKTVKNVTMVDNQPNQPIFSVVVLDEYVIEAFVEVLEELVVEGDVTMGKDGHNNEETNTHLLIGGYAKALMPLLQCWKMETHGRIQEPNLAPLAANVNLHVVVVVTDPSRV